MLQLISDLCITKHKLELLYLVQVTLQWILFFIFINEESSQDVQVALPCYQTDVVSRDLLGHCCKKALVLLCIIGHGSSVVDHQQHVFRIHAISASVIQIARQLPFLFVLYIFFNFRKLAGKRIFDHFDFLEYLRISLKELIDPFPPFL